jgi:hypothetical protein
MNPPVESNPGYWTSPENASQVASRAPVHGSRPALRLDVAMIKQLLELVDHDGCDGELIIEWWDTPRDDEKPEAPGYYAVMNDYPELGGFPVMTFAENDQALAREALPAAPCSPAE